MSSDSDQDLIKTAIEICCGRDFKTDVFFVSGKGVMLIKKMWDLKVEQKALDSFQTFSFQEDMREKVVGYVLCISMRMLTWIEYHARTFHLSVDFCVDFLESKFFTKNGLINDEKVVNALLDEGTNLKNIVKYRIACYYCVLRKVSPLHKKLSVFEKNCLYDYRFPEKIKEGKLVKFWTYSIMGEINKLRGNTPVDYYRLECAVESGLRMAVKYCLESTYLSKSSKAPFKAAIDLIKWRQNRELYSVNLKTTNDWIVFDEEKYGSNKYSWIPNYFFADTLFYIVSNLKTVERKIEMLKKLFAAIKMNTFNDKTFMEIKFLEYFLMWPHQDQFLELLKLSIPFMVESSYGSFLADVCDRIDPVKGNLYYGESKCYDYRQFFEELWCAGTDSFKRYIYADKKVIVDDSDQNNLAIGVTFNEAKSMLTRLYNYLIIIPKQKKVIELILRDGNEEEKRNVLESYHGMDICKKLLSNGNYQEFDDLVSICISSRERRQEFRKIHSFTVAKNLCLDAIKDDQYDSINIYLEWSKLTEDEKLDLKEKILKSEEGKEACRELVVSRTHSAELLIKWGLHTSTASSFKYDLLTETEGIDYCKQLVMENSFELTDKFIIWGLGSADGLNEFKKTELAPAVGFSICEDIITDRSHYEITNADENFDRWSHIECFLEWCFGNSHVMEEFKKDFIKKCTESIIFKFVEIFDFVEAEIYFSWAQITPDELKQMRKEKLFWNVKFSDYLSDFLAMEKEERLFIDNGGKQHVIDYYLMWMLVDKDIYKEFKVRYRKLCDNDYVKTALSKVSERFKSN